MARSRLRDSVWTALALCLQCVHQSAAGGDECDMVCLSIKAEVSSSDACAKAQKSLPRPKIGRICQEAFDDAVRLTCVEACKLQGAGRTPPGRLKEVCNKRKREVPRPVAQRACVDGYNAGFAATTAFIRNYVESTEEEARNMSEENEAVLIGAARDERQDPDQIGRAQGAGKTHQVVEGQEQTKEAIEEHTTDVDVQRDISSIQQKLDGIRAEEEQESIQEIEDQTRQAHFSATTKEQDYTVKPSEIRVERDSPALHLDDTSKISHETLSKSHESARAEAFVESRGPEVLTADHARSIDAPVDTENDLQHMQPQQQTEKREKIVYSHYSTATGKFEGRFDPIPAQDVAEQVGSPRSTGVHTAENVGDLLALELEHVEVENDQYLPGSTVAGASMAQTDGGENQGFIDLPRNSRFQEVLRAEHVHGFGETAQKLKASSGAQGLQATVEQIKPVAASRPQHSEGGVIEEISTIADGVGSDEAPDDPGLGNVAAMEVLHDFNEMSGTQPDIRSEGYMEPSQDIEPVPS